MKRLYIRRITIRHKRDSAPATTPAPSFTNQAQWDSVAADLIHAKITIEMFTDGITYADLNTARNRIDHALETLALIAAKDTRK